MSFSVTMLGTASAAPFSDRNPSAQALSVHGRLYLLDCGEGTQQRLRQEHLSFAKVRAVFISHTHGDHIYGLFGLLSTLSLYHRTEPLPIFGPQSLGSIIDFFLSSFGEELGYSIEFTPISIEQPTPIFSDGEVVFSAFPLRHSVECYGYICTQTKEHRGAAPTKCSYAYCSDTASFPELPSWLKG